jgi:hypothetical protein
MFLAIGRQYVSWCSIRVMVHGVECRGKHGQSKFAVRVHSSCTLALCSGIVKP